MSSFFVHPSAFLDDGVVIGSGSQVWHGCHMMKGSQIGRDCVLGQNVFIGPGVRLGNGVRVQNNVSLYAGVICKDHVFIGPSAVFTNVLNPRAWINRKSEFLTTIVEEGATIGANATVICGHRMGEFSMVGAGAVVVADVPDYGLVYGNPARLKDWVCQCGAKLVFAKEEAECRCGLSYRLSGSQTVHLMR